MPILGLGTWESKADDLHKPVKEAIKIGYRHIDCAAIYGNEKEVGQAIKEALDEGIVKREDLWITSKLWSDAHGREYVIPALKKTLADLQLDYLDLYEIHWPVPLKHGVPFAKTSEDFALEQYPLSDTWEAMEEAYSQGLVRHIGVSNFSIRKLKSILKNAKIKPEMNQIELNAYMQQDPLVDFCKANDIHLTAYAPLGSSGRAEDLKTEGEPILLQDTLIKSIADKKGVSLAQVLLAWIIKREIAVIPKSVHTKRMKENIEAANVNLTEEEVAEIKKINKNNRYINGNFWLVENGPIKLTNLWE